MDNRDQNIYLFDSVYKFDCERNRFVFGSVENCYGHQNQDVGLNIGEIQVLWEQKPDEAEICQESEVRLMSRYIPSGEVVKKVKNGSGTQKGLCLETKEIATVQVKSTGAIVEHVARNRFYDDWTKTIVGDAVTFGDHVGRIKSVNRLLHMWSQKDNVSVTARVNIDENQIRDCYWADVGNNNFRRIIDCVPNTLIDPKWLNGTECNDMGKKQGFIIMEDRLYSLQVCWLLPDGGTKIEEFEGDDTEKLNIVVSRCRYGLFPGAFLFMRTDPDDIFIEKSEWFQQLSDLVITGKEKRGRERNYDSMSMSDHSKHPESDEELLVVVICVESRATVLWQDGTVERDILSNELYICDSLDDHEFLPGYCVVLNELDEDEEDIWGVVKSVDFTERVAEVQWSTHAFGCKCSECKESKNFNVIDEQSVYDLKIHDMFSLDLHDDINTPIFYKLPTNGAILGKPINISPENGSVVIQWSDNSTEYYLPGVDGFGVLPVLKDLLANLESIRNDSSWDRSDLDERYKSERTESNKESEKIPDAVNDDETLVVEGFCFLDEAPEKHAYYSNKFEPKDMRKFVKAIQHEYKLLKKSLPAGVWVHAYGDRTDLLSVMFRGAKDTPYEDGLFMFDIQLCADYPENPPRLHFISYIDEQLNPNLYIDGNVCVSLLGTWHGQGSEVWTTNSNLLQLIVSIQGLILVAEPYYNEAGYERDRYTQKGQENSRTYNESAILKVLKSMTEILGTSPQEFQSVVRSHFKKNGEEIIRRIESFCNEECTENPDYPLLPLSKGVKLSLNLHLKKFSKTLAKVSEASKSNQF